MAKKVAFVFHNSWFKFLDKLTNDQNKTVINAVSEYSRGNEIPVLDREELNAFILMKNQIDFDRQIGIYLDAEELIEKANGRMD